MKIVFYFLSLLAVFFTSMLFLTCGIKILVFAVGYFSGALVHLGLNDFLWALKISTFLSIVFSLLYLMIGFIRMAFKLR